MTGPWIELIGFMAAGMTVTAFYCTRMLTLRVAAIAANAMFITYGFMLDLKPVLALHCVLLPLNAARLLRCLAERRAAPAGDEQARSRS